MAEPGKRPDPRESGKETMRRTETTQGSGRHNRMLLLIVAIAAALLILFLLWPRQPNADEPEETPRPEPATYYAAAIHLEAPNASLAAAVSRKEWSLAAWS